jgi:hypothetical protein
MVRVVINHERAESSVYWLEWPKLVRVNTTFYGNMSDSYFWELDVNDVNPLIALYRSYMRNMARHEEYYGIRVGKLLSIEIYVGELDSQRNVYTIGRRIPTGYVLYNHRSSMWYSVDYVTDALAMIDCTR